jgi:hypothetical protein
MHKPIVTGQALNGLALIVLATVAGAFPRVSGSYPYRPAEMLAFWLGFALLLWGMRLTRSALPAPYSLPGFSAPSPNAAGASLAVLVGVLVGVFSLVNFFYSTLWGLRWLPEAGANRLASQLIPPGMGVGWLAVPLLVTAICQIPLAIRAFAYGPVEMQSVPQRPGIVYWLALAASVGLFLLFIGASMASLINRHALAAVVGATLLEALIVAVISLEQFLWSLPRTLNLPPPYTAR